jgi:RNA polymerase sporulation-specific sigma factor
MQVDVARSIKPNLEAMPEECVVEKARDGSVDAQEFLIRRYKNFVRLKAKSYFLIGADKEDIIQEGMIGLFKAIRDYKVEKCPSFKAFAELCITRQMITAVKAATRQKHMPLNSYVSLDQPLHDDESDQTLLDVVAMDFNSDPAHLLISRETVGLIESKMTEVLSDFELKVLNAHLDGRNYHEIAKDLDRHAKSIDNALQRIKRKLERFVSQLAHDSPT